MSVLCLGLGLSVARLVGGESSSIHPFWGEEGLGREQGEHWGHQGLGEEQMRLNSTSSSLEGDQWPLRECIAILGDHWPLTINHPQQLLHCTEQIKCFY